MSQSACKSQFFNDLSQIGFSLGKLLPVGAGGANKVITVARPFIPIVGKVGTGYDTIAKNQTYLGTNSLAQHLFGEAYQASINKVNASLALPSIADGSFDQYAYKNLFGKTDQLARFDNTRNLITNFWNSVNLAWTPDQFLKAVADFIEQCKNDLDKNIFISPGVYTFSSADDFVTTYDLWKAATPGLDGIITLEIVSI